MSIFELISLSTNLLFRTTEPLCIPIEINEFSRTVKIMSIQPVFVSSLFDKHGFMKIIICFLVYVVSYTEVAKPYENLLNIGGYELASGCCCLHNPYHNESYFIKHNI